MKKVFSVFLVFATFFIVSCGGLLEEDSDNTVRFKLSGNARAASGSDVSYYNVAINNESFRSLPPGSEVKSSPITVGTPVSITVTAIGNYPDIQEGTNVPIAIFSTSETMKSGGIEIDVKMKDYALEYVKMTFSMGGDDDLRYLNFSSVNFWLYGQQAAAPCWNDRSKQYFILPSGTKPKDTTSGRDTITEWSYTNNGGHTGRAKPGDVIRLQSSGSGYTFTPNPGN